MLLRNIKGQDSPKKYLLNILSSGRIADSYIFSGPKGVGRTLTASAFITALICPSKDMGGDACMVCPSCRRIQALEHPDVRWIRPEKNKTIKIEEIREVKSVLSLKPYEAPVSVCVIEDAHMMTVEASNALLKLLEEPPESSLLVLLTHKKELLLPTVISRCVDVRFRSLTFEDTKQIIMENADVDERSADFLAYFSQGSPGAAMELIEEGVQERKEEIFTMVDEIVREDNFSCLTWDREDRGGIAEDIEMLVMLFRDVALGKEGLDDLVLNRDILGMRMYTFLKEYPMEKIYEIVENLIRIKTALSGSVNPKIVAQILPSKLK